MKPNKAHDKTKLVAPAIIMFNSERTSIESDPIDNPIDMTPLISFKPKTDDMREAPSRVVMESLWTAGAKVQAFDPEAMEETQRIYGSREDLALMGTKEAALKGADALVICTEWQSFKAPDFELIKAELKQPVIFDGRSLFDPERVKAKGGEYYGIGRGLSVDSTE